MRIRTFEGAGRAIVAATAIPGVCGFVVGSVAGADMVAGKALGPSELGNIFTNGHIVSGVLTGVTNSQLDWETTGMVGGGIGLGLVCAAAGYLISTKKILGR